MKNVKTGFIGLGQMGHGMASNLLKHAGNIAIYDPAPDATISLTEQGATVCASAAHVASECELIFLCVPQAEHSRAVLFGEKGIVSAGKETLTIIDTTTLDRTDAISIGAQAASAGISYSDCPVSGLPKRAADGTLTLMFGGSKTVFDEVNSDLASFGDAIYCGQLGSGQAMKAVNNIIYNINIVALCEVLPLAVAAGLDPQVLADVVTQGSSRSFASSHFVQKMLEGQFSHDFTLSSAYKDIVNIQKLGVETRASLPLVHAMISSYQAAIAAGYGDEPKSAILKVYEKVLGVQFRRPETA